MVPGPAPPLLHRYGFPREAVTSGLWLRAGSLDYRVHSGPSLCHQHISTIKCPTCFPDLLCPWASHPRASMTFHSPAGKLGHSHPLRPLLCDQPCHLQGSHSTLPAPASPCSPPHPLFPEDWGLHESSCPAPTPPYSPSASSCSVRFSHPRVLLSQANSCHFLMTLLRFIRSDNISEHFSHIGYHARCLTHTALLNLGHVPKY